jgi:REP element-mobilizing transposase RayT
MTIPVHNGLERGTGVPPVGKKNHGRDAHATEAKDGSPRGTGVSPVRGNTHGRDAHATANTTLQIRQGAYLPHWTLSQGGMYAVTFRLADSLPKPVLERFLRERETLKKESLAREGVLSKDEEARLAHLYSEKVETYLDAGNGSCWLKRADIADLVVSALQHFDNIRYRLHTWCIMPNHVHVLVEPLPGFSLADIVHSWKSFTAKAANKHLGRTGDFWQQEYYDHLIRDETDYAHAIWYIKQNPQKAGLHDWPWVHRGTGVPPVVSSEDQHEHQDQINNQHGRDARATE